MAQLSTPMESAHLPCNDLTGRTQSPGTSTGPRACLLGSPPISLGQLGRDCPASPPEHSPHLCQSPSADQAIVQAQMTCAPRVLLTGTQLENDGLHDGGKVWLFLHQKWQLQLWLEAERQGSLTQAHTLTHTCCLTHIYAASGLHRGSGKMNYQLIRRGANGTASVWERSSNSNVTFCMDCVLKFVNTSTPTGVAGVKNWS